MGDDDSFDSVVTVICPRCGVECRFAITRVLGFPNDAALILDLVNGKLNLRTCPVCGWEMPIRISPVVFADGGSRLAVAGLSAPEMEELRTALAEKEMDGAGIESHVDPDALRQTVAGWLGHYLTEALAPLQEGSDPVPESDGVMAHQRPLVLLALARMCHGEMPVFLRGESTTAEQDDERVRALLTHFTVSLVDRLFTHAFHHRGIDTVLDLVGENVPAECLDDEVLAHLSERCPETSAESWLDPQQIDTAFRYEYLNAVAHVAAHRPNPRGLRWATVSGIMFRLSQEPNVVVPAEALLNTGVLSRTIEFGDAWNAAYADVEEFSNEQFEEYEAWFDHIGWGDRFRQEWANVPIMFDPDWLAEVDELEFLAELRSRVDLSEPDRGDGVASTLAAVFARAGLNEKARNVLLGVENRLAAEAEWERLGWLAIRGAEALNGHADYIGAEAVLRQHLERALAETSGRLRYSLVNELGNSLRYRGDAAAALGHYEWVEELMSKSDDVPPEDRSVLVRNRAIVLRELGHFDRASAQLEAQLAGDDLGLEERVSLLVSLARTYFDAGMPERALPPAEEAASATLSPSRPTQRVEVLLALAAARAGAEPEAEIPELSEAILLAEGLPRMAEIAAAATLHHARRAAVEHDTVARARAILKAAVADPPADSSPSIQATAAYCLAEWELSQGRASRAAEILTQLSQALGGERLPWAISHLEARLPGTDTEKAWSLMRRALDRLDRSVPDAAGQTFASSFLTDKDDFQRFLLFTLRAALEQGYADAIDCIDVFEFVNGREMRGGEPAELAPDAEAAGTLIERLGRATGPARVLVALLFEYEDDVQAVCLRPRTEEWTIRPLAIDARQLREASAAFARRVGLSCLTDRQMEAAADSVDPVLVAVGEAVGAVASPGEQICLLPSPALLGLPLHAARRADGPLLLEHHCVSIAPNLSVLCRLLEHSDPPQPAGDSAIAVVGKRGDREEFVAGAEAAAEAIGARLGTEDTRVLVGTEASKDAVLGQFSSCEHLVFVGHGAWAASTNGRGICVAAGGDLPSAPLAVDAVPELRRFMIDAGDLEALSHTPAMFVSTACSSGRSFSGRGGTRLGLERALFAAGTRTILAPLWDVHQPSALRFLTTFYEYLTDNERTVTVAEAHRQACLTLRDDLGHLFLWAPFVLNGSWS
ncbi:MAG: CHAT domain-containing protein [Solirubrobacterales bacterium]